MGLNLSQLATGLTTLFAGYGSLSDLPDALKSNWTQNAVSDFQSSKFEIDSIDQLSQNNDPSNQPLLSEKSFQWTLFADHSPLSLDKIESWDSYDWFSPISNDGSKEFIIDADGNKLEINKAVCGEICIGAFLLFSGLMLAAVIASALQKKENLKLRKIITESSNDTKKLEALYHLLEKDHDLCGIDLKQFGAEGLRILGQLREGLRSLNQWEVSNLSNDIKYLKRFISAKFLLPLHPPLSLDDKMYIAALRFSDLIIRNPFDDHTGPYLDEEKHLEFLTTCRELDITFFNLKDSRLEDCTIDMAQFLYLIRHDINIIGVNIKGGLKNLNLFAKNLDKISITDAKEFYDLDLSYATLKRATLTIAQKASQSGNLKLNFTNLTGAKIENISFQNSTIDFTIFEAASIYDCNFSHITMNRPDFSYAKIWRTSFENCTVENGNFENAEIKYSNLANANLSGCNLKNATILVSDLKQLKGLNLTGANLEGTRFILEHIVRDEKELTMDELRKYGVIFEEPTIA